MTKGKYVVILGFSINTRVFYFLIWFFNLGDYSMDDLFFNQISYGK